MKMIFKIMFLMSGLSSMMPSAFTFTLRPGGPPTKNYFSPRSRRSGEVVQLLQENGLADRGTPIEIPYEDNSYIFEEPFLQTNKRSTLLLDKILFALQRAVNDRKIHSPSKSGDNSISNKPSEAQEGEEEVEDAVRQQRMPNVAGPINYSAYSGVKMQK